MQVELEQHNQHGDENSEEESARPSFILASMGNIYGVRLIYACTLLMAIGCNKNRKLWVSCKNTELLLCFKCQKKSSH